MHIGTILKDSFKTMFKVVVQKSDWRSSVSRVLFASQIQFRSIALLRNWTKSIRRIWNWTKTAILTRDHKFQGEIDWSRVKLQFGSTFKLFECALLVQIRSKAIDRNCICEANPKRDTEILQSLFWAKDWTHPLLLEMVWFWGVFQNCTDKRPFVEKIKTFLVPIRWKVVDFWYFEKVWPKTDSFLSEHFVSLHASLLPQESLTGFLWFANFTGVKSSKSLISRIMFPQISNMFQPNVQWSYVPLNISSNHISISFYKKKLVESKVDGPRDIKWMVCESGRSWNGKNWAVLLVSFPTAVRLETVHF